MTARDDYRILARFAAHPSRVNEEVVRALDEIDQLRHEVRRLLRLTEIYRDELDGVEQAEILERFGPTVYEALPQGEAIWLR